MEEAVKDEKVFIIGNGFDCCLGWHTKYSDFVQSGFFKTIPEDSGLASHLIRNASLDKWLDMEKELYKYAMPLFAFFLMNFKGFIVVIFCQIYERNCIIIK